MEFTWTTLVLVGLVFLLAPGFVRYGILPAAAPDRVINGRWVLPWVGAAMLAAGTVGEVAQVVWTALGTIDLTMTLAYVTETRHGRVSLARLGLLATFLVAWLLLPPLWCRIGYTVLGSALVLSVSLTSHAAGEGRYFLVAADAVHLAAVAVWVGTVVSLALMPVWDSQTPPSWLEAAIHRTSAIGLVAVAAIVLTGAYGVWAHFWNPMQLFGTPYGQALVIKLMVVAPVLGLAALNRWVLAPKAAHHGQLRQLGWSIRIEAALLILALIAAAHYVTRSPPGEPSSLLEPVEIAEALGPYHIHAVFLPSTPGFRLQLEITDDTALPVAAEPEPRLVLDMIDHRMVPLHPAVEPIGTGEYQAHDVFTMPGRWQARLEIGDDALIIFLDARP